MSRPESVSSSTATFGLSSSSWTISWRFFSPPEKPSLTERCANVGSSLSCSMAALTSLTQVRSLGASPSMAVFAVRRKFDDRDAGHLDGVLHGEEQPGARPLVDGHREHVDAVEGHRAAGDGVLRVAGDRVGQRRLAGAVGAHDRVRLAAR